jgi:hypothetical protein
MITPSTAAYVAALVVRKSPGNSRLLITGSVRVENGDTLYALCRARLPTQPAARIAASGKLASSVLVPRGATSGIASASHSVEQAALIRYCR